MVLEIWREAINVAPLAARDYFDASSVFTVFDPPLQAIVRPRRSIDI